VGGVNCVWVVCGWCSSLRTALDKKHERSGERVFFSLLYSFFFSSVKLEREEHALIVKQGC